MENNKIKTGTKFTNEGWLELEKIRTVPDVTFEHLVGLIIDENSAGNIGNIDRFLEFANGYKVNIIMEIIDTPENRPDSTKIPARDGYCTKCGKKIQ